MTIQPTIVVLAVELRRPPTTGRIMIARRGHPNLDFVQEVGTRSTASLIRPTERWWLLPKTDAAVTNPLSAYVASQIRAEATFISFLPQTLKRFSFLFFHTVRISPIRWPYERTNAWLMAAARPTEPSPIYWAPMQCRWELTLHSQRFSLLFTDERTSDFWRHTGV